jgi:hypothetical protein
MARLPAPRLGGIELVFGLGLDLVAVGGVWHSTWAPLCRRGRRTQQVHAVEAREETGEETGPAIICATT